LQKFRVGGLLIRDTGLPAIRRARAGELEVAQEIVNVAFATQFGLPSVEAFGDRMTLAPRWHADPENVIVAELDGRIVGSNAITTWGTFGWFGPLTVRPELWNRGIARALLDATMERFAARGTTTEALYTFASSPKHLALYQRYGFWPRRLTATLARAPVGAESTAFRRLSAVEPAARAAAIAALAPITAALRDGLDVSVEMRIVLEQRLGDVLVIDDARGRPAAFAVCHAGRGSEAGSNAVSVKFGAATGAAPFAALLDAVLAYGATAGVDRVVVPVNTAREAAYRAALAAGFAIAHVGVAMIRGDDAYDHPDAWVIEDHR
jgi:GNAT superfamily N-acetyltransferase